MHIFYDSLLLIRLDNQFTHSTNLTRPRTRRSQSSRTDPYTIPERFHHNRTPGYPLPHLSDTSHQRLTVPLQTVLPSVSAAVVYPTSVSLPQQLITGVAPPVPSFLLTSLETATSHIIGSAYSSAAAHSDSLNAQGTADNYRCSSTCPLLPTDVTGDRYQSHYRQCVQ